MDGIHDLGGMDGFGPLPQSRDAAEAFTARELSVQSLLVAALARELFNIDEFRHGIERIDPADYLLSSHAERWYDSIERNLVEKGRVTAAELSTHMARLDQQSSSPPPSTEGVSAGPAPRLTGRPYRRDGPAPGFSVGDRVVTRNLHPKGHTRLPRYARAKHGVIQRVRGAFVFPDTNAHGLGEQPQAVYSVRFDARELWGEDSEPAASMSLDLWESYLEPDRERPRTRAERSQSG